MTIAEHIQLHQQQRTEQIIAVDEPSQQFVIFQLANDLYAIPGKLIQEILAQETVYPLPNCPALIEGVIHLRGSIESVIQLGGLLNSATNDSTNKSRLLLAQTEALKTALRVDAVIDVIELVLSNIQAKPNNLPDHLDPWVLGIFSHQQQPVLYLDLAALLAHYVKQSR